MFSTGFERFSDVEGVDSDVVLDDVAFIGGEQGPDPAQLRQNQNNEDDVAFISGESGPNLAQVRQNEHNTEGGAPCPPPDTIVPPVTANYLGGTMLM